jgi:hypothetical protein
MREGFMRIFDLNINLLATDADNLVVYRHLCLSLSLVKSANAVQAWRRRFSPSRSVSQPNGLKRKMGCDLNHTGLSRDRQSPGEIGLSRQI